MSDAWCWVQVLTGERISKHIRNAEKAKTPVMCVVGQNEVDSGTSSHLAAALLSWHAACTSAQQYHHKYTEASSGTQQGPLSSGLTPGRMQATLPSAHIMVAIRAAWR